MSGLTDLNNAVVALAEVVATAVTTITDLQSQVATLTLSAGDSDAAVGDAAGQVANSVQTLQAALPVANTVA